MARRFDDAKVHSTHIHHITLLQPLIGCHCFGLHHAEHGGTHRDGGKHRLFRLMRANHFDAQPGRKISSTPGMIGMAMGQEDFLDFYAGLFNRFFDTRKISSRINHRAALALIVINDRSILLERGDRNDNDFERDHAFGLARSASAVKPAIPCAPDQLCEAPMENLITIRDMLRFAVTRMNKAGVVHGHGATNAVDEAAFMILESLRLPVLDINPWAEARLTKMERTEILALIEQRITTRKPAAYLLKRTYMQGIAFYVDERVIIPRSYIGEMLARGLLTDLVIDFENIGSVLDLCTGSGCLAILAAGQFPQAQIHATDLSQDALDVAAINVKDHNLEQRITLHHGDLFAPLGKQKFDFIISNPPYVAQAEVDAFPPEYAHEPQLAHLGGSDGFDLVRKILAEAPDHLNQGGGLLCEVGTGGDSLEAEFPHLDFFWLDAEEAEGEVFFLKF